MPRSQGTGGGAGVAALSHNVLVLNRFYQAIRVVNVRRAFSMLFRELAEVIRRLPGQGVTILLIEQNMRLAEAVADEIHIMVKGRVVYAASPEQFRAEEANIRSRYLTV